MILKKYNFALLLLPFLIFSLGFMSLLSTYPQKATDQAVFFVVGFGLYVLSSLLDYKLLKLYWKIPYVFIIALLFFTYIVGEVRSGSARWIDLGFFVLQPSEFAKMVVILALAVLLSSGKVDINNLRELAKLTVLVVSISILILVQPDLGTALVILAIFIGMLFYAGVKKLYFLVAFLLGGAISTPVWNLLKDYQKQRILVFLNPSLDVLGSGYNVTQSIISVGSGRLFGKGFGYGTQSHLRFLPVYWSDFIFAAFAEEWGFVGVAMILLTFFFLLATLLYIAYKIDDPFGSFVTIGVFFMILTQFVINVGMNLGVMPVTGIPLPLVSSGGSSMFATMILLGLVQGIWVRRKI